MDDDHEIFGFCFWIAKYLLIEWKSLMKSFIDVIIVNQNLLKDALKSEAMWNSSAMDKRRRLYRGERLWSKAFSAD